MSGPDLEEDSLISQDDIDKLLASSSIEEAEEKEIEAGKFIPAKPSSTFHDSLVKLQSS